MCDKLNVYLRMTLEETVTGIAGGLPEELHTGWPKLRSTKLNVQSRSTYPESEWPLEERLHDSAPLLGTRSSVPERFKVVCIQCKALY